MTSIFRKLADLWSLVVGLGITGKYFCSPQVTVHYPRATVDPEVNASYRGPIELIGLDKDPAKPRCIACMLCAQACPSGCISVTRAPAPKPTPEEIRANAEAEARGEKPKKPSLPKTPGTWVYDFTLCSLCGTCVEVCPVESLRFSQNIYLAGPDRASFRFDLLQRLARQAASGTPAGAGQTDDPAGHVAGEQGAGGAPSGTAANKPATAGMADASVATAPAASAQTPASEA